MSGTHIGRLKARTGFGKPEYKRGSMIATMNSKKKSFMTTPFSELSGGKFSTAGGAIAYGVKQGVKDIGKAANFAGNLGRAFVRNATGGDVKAILKNKKGSDGKKVMCKTCGKTHRNSHGKKSRS